MAHLVLAGPGHAHLTALRELRRFVEAGHRVTVVGPSPLHYYSGMAPGLLAGTYRPHEARFAVRRMVEERGGTYRTDAVAAVDPHTAELRLASGGSLSYDVVSFNVGSRVSSEPGPEADASVFLPVKPIENFLAARRLAMEAMASGTARILVAGGGPAGVEAAGGFAALAALAGGRAEISLVSAGPLLRGFPEAAREEALASLLSRGVMVREGVRFEGARGRQAALSDGTAQAVDVAMLAAGVRPPPLFVGSELPTGRDGGLLVDGYLRSVGFPNVFGGGDCVTLRGAAGLARVGVYAVRQNRVLCSNLLSALDGRPLEPWRPGNPRHLLILNLGDGTAVLCKGGRAWRGRLALRLKDWIDRRFMRRFQVSGEREEA